MRKTPDPLLQQITIDPLPNNTLRSSLSAWREFLASGNMTLVRMAISCYGKVKMVPGYLKHPSVEWIGDDQIECYSTSDGHIIIETHRNKVKVDEARREIPGLEKELQYNISQVNKINNELKEGRLGRSGDREKFEAKVNELRNEIKLRNDIVDTAVTDVIKFDIEDCD